MKSPGLERSMLGSVPSTLRVSGFSIRVQTVVLPQTACGICRHPHVEEPWKGVSSFPYAHLQALDHIHPVKLPHLSTLPPTDGVHLIRR